MHVSTLQQIFEQAWGPDTAYQGRWSPDCPSLNQCAVTALVVQDLFGGELLRCPLKGRGHHYWNRLPDGKELDLTADQFAFTRQLPLKDRKIVGNRRQLL